jgi:hypothetical protein
MTICDIGCFKKATNNKQTRAWAVVGAAKCKNWQKAMTNQPKDGFFLI